MRNVDLIAFALAAFLAMPVCEAAQYSIRDLGLPGRTAVEVSINNRGQVVVSIAPEEPLGLPPMPGEAFIIDENGMTGLGSLGGINVIASGINDNGAVVGWGDVGGATGHSFLYRANQIQDLGINGTRGGIATGINNKGEIVGIESFADNTVAFHRDINGIVRHLESLGGNWTQASDINELGEIVGASRNSANYFEAFLDGPRGLEPLGTLGGSESHASAINDHSMIVGVAQPPDNIQHAVLFIPGSTTPIDLAPSWAQSGASDINNLGQIVGFVTDTPDRQLQAALFSTSGPPILLHDLIPSDSGWTTLYAASGINDQGQIVGAGIYNGEPGIRAFLLTPIPEPSFPALLVVAAHVLAASANRRRSS
jgi:probable HAF family extracellular repeat protein